jgi:predicted dienelactone hydrolase
VTLLSRFFAPLFALLFALLPAAGTAATICDTAWRDPVRGRLLPVRIWLPDGTGRLPAVIWSPGLGADIGAGGQWARAWSAAGLAVIVVQHPGGDRIAYPPGGTPAERKARVLAAASPAQQMARAGDIGTALDALARRDGSCDLARIDTDRIGVAGHSIGAWTVQSLAGQMVAGERPFLDRRPRAFLVFSGTLADQASMEGIGRPFMVISGTRDGNPGDDIVAKRSAPWRSLPADGRKYLAMFGDATHMMFAGNRAATTALGRHVETGVIRLTTAFWRRWLLDDDAADAVLASPGLAAADQWARK